MPSFDWKSRLQFVFAFFAAGCLLLAGRAFHWQVLNYDALSKLAQDERQRTTTIPAQRGDILTSDGFLLASDVFIYEVDARPREIIGPEKVAGYLSPVLEMPQDQLIQQFKQDKDMIVLTRAASAQAGAQLEKLQALEMIPGIEFTARPYRRYPGNAFAASVIGFVNAERKPAYGVEQFYNDELTGRDGKLAMISNVYGDDPLPFNLPQGTEAIPGATLVLTLNSAMQNIAERELQKAVVSNGATGGSLIVMEPRTGAIRAMALYPTANLNDYGKTALTAYNNANVSLLYEPGSVFKVVTTACALDYGLVNTNTTFNDTGSITVGGRTIYNHDFIKAGIVDLVKVLRLSLNVEAARMALLMGANKFYDCVRRFGFGGLTGVDLAGEIQGTVKLPGDGRWYEADLGTNAFGQGLASTPLQMVTSLAIVANDGRWVTPHIIERIVRPDGTVEPYVPKGTRQAIRPETSQTLINVLSQSIVAESLNKATIPGYKIAGKTGTSQIPIPGGYDPVATIASFGGFFPADDPRYVILVKIDRPKKSPWGSEVASPVFSTVAQQIAALVGLPPDAERTAAKK